MPRKTTRTHKFLNQLVQSPGGDKNAAAWMHSGVFFYCISFVSFSFKTIATRLLELTRSKKLALVTFAWLKADEAEDSDEEWGNWSAGGTSDDSGRPKLI